MRPHLQSNIPQLAHADACRTRRSAQRTPGRDARRSSVEPRSASRSAPLRSPIARMNNRRGRLRAHRRTPCRNGRPWYSHHVRDAFRVALPSGTAYPSIRGLSARMTRAVVVPRPGRVDPDLAFKFGCGGHLLGLSCELDHGTAVGANATPGTGAAAAPKRQLLPVPAPSSGCFPEQGRTRCGSLTDPTRRLPSPRAS